MPENERNLPRLTFSYNYSDITHSSPSVILNPRYFGQFRVTVTLPFSPIIVRITGGIYDNLYCGTGGVVELGRACSL